MGRFLKPMLRDAGISEAAANKFRAPTFFLLLTIGRLVGGVVLTVLTPTDILPPFLVAGAPGPALALMTGVQWLAVPGVFAAGLGFANIWPLLFSITVEEKPDRANELSGLMCMAISGGAIVPLVMGGLVDLKFGAYAFIVPAACFAYLLRSTRLRAAESSPQIDIQGTAVPCPSTKTNAS